MKMHIAVSAALLVSAQAFAVPVETQIQAAGITPTASIYSWALNNHWHNNFQLRQEGVLTFRYGILPHNSGFDAAASNRFGLEQARPLIATPAKESVAVTPPVTIDNPRVVISSVKSLRLEN